MQRHPSYKYFQLQVADDSRPPARYNAEGTGAEPRCLLVATRFSSHLLNVFARKLISTSLDVVFVWNARHLTFTLLWVPDRSL
jgi:hypothetical protein